MWVVGTETTWLTKPKIVKTLTPEIVFRNNLE
jgi:hypothetical protein